MSVVETAGERPFHQEPGFSEAELDWLVEHVDEFLGEREPTPEHFFVLGGRPVEDVSPAGLVRRLQRPTRQAALAQVTEGLGRLDLPAGVAAQVSVLLTCAVAHHPAASAADRGCLGDPAAGDPATGDAATDVAATADPGTVELEAAQATADPVPADPVPDVSASAPTAATEPATSDCSDPMLWPASSVDCADEVLLAAAGAGRGLAGFTDAVVLAAVRSLTHRAAVELLGRRGVADPAELTKSARDKWRAQAKSVVAHELQVLTGWGLQDCHDRVGFALAPQVATRPAQQALDLGVSDWREVGEWWRRCRRMLPEVAGQVSATVFTPRVTAATAAATAAAAAQAAQAAEDAEQAGGQDSADDLPDDPLTPDLALQQSPRRGSFKEFIRDLDREVTRAVGADDKSARQARRVALERRNAYAQLCDDGTGTFVVSGPAASIAACTDRIETIARKARAGGDQRTIAQLRADTALALLVHGVLPLPTPPQVNTRSKGTSEGARDTTPHPTYRVGDPGAEMSEEDLAALTEELHRILRALPATSLEVIVPLPVLTGHAHDVASAGADTDHRPASVAPADAGADDDAPAGAGAHNHARPADAPADADAGGSSGPLGAQRSHQLGVAEIVGHGFLTPEHARDLALRTGGVLHRLVTDPVDGRLVERSITSYSPDPAMAAQVRAADVFCRAPGCLVPAARCDLDHEEPFAAGGATSETNLNTKHRAHHTLKTLQLWHTAMDSTRDLTWTTFFGRIYPTHPHDYSQYTTTHSRPDPDSRAGGDPDAPDVPAAGEPGLPDFGAVRDPDLRNRLVYAALSSRQGQDRWLEALDDYDGAYEGPFELPVGLFHRRGSVRRSGPTPGQRTPAQLLADLGAGPWAPNTQVPTPAVAASPSTDQSTQSTPARTWRQAGEDAPPPF